MQPPNQKRQFRGGLAGSSAAVLCCVITSLTRRSASACGNSGARGYELREPECDPPVELAAETACKEREASPARTCAAG